MSCAMKAELSRWRDRLLMQFGYDCDKLLGRWHFIFQLMKFAEEEMPMWVFGVGTMCERLRGIVWDDGVHGFIAFIQIFFLKRLFFKVSFVTEVSYSQFV